MKRSSQRAREETYGVPRCELLDTCKGVPTARVEISGLINPNLTTDQLLTVRHWCGDVCARCLVLLYNEQARYPETASLRILQLDSVDWGESTIVGNGRVFESGTLLAHLHPALRQIKTWTRTAMRGAQESDETAIDLTRDTLAPAEAIELVQGQIDPADATDHASGTAAEDDTRAATSSEGDEAPTQTTDAASHKSETPSAMRSTVLPSVVQHE